MKDKKKVLIIDDEKGLLAALDRAFSVARRFDFAVTKVHDVKEVITRGLEDADYDICVVDLGFNRSGREFFDGFLALIALSELNRAELRIVYSGHPDLKYVVRSMQCGADDFVSKVEVRPDQLVERVEDMLIERQNQQIQTELIRKHISQCHRDFERSHPGRVLAIIATGSGPTVIADGRSRLDVLLKYAELRLLHEEWPNAPHLHIVPPGPTSKGTADE
ncbi:MAG: response regulator [Planctomycetota bacterium]